MREKCKPKKRLGQNFLTNQGIAQKLVKSAQVNKEDLVLEIGPGTGVLTKEIAKLAKRVIAVEKDKELIKGLKEELKRFNNIEIVNEDILNYKLPAEKYKVISNLPFYITSPVIRRFLEDDNPPETITLIIQKEVAQRITAKPPRMNLLAVSVQVYSKVEIISYVSKGSFYPIPKVDSAIIQITPCYSLLRKKTFFKIVKAGFSSPRKQIINNLSKDLMSKEKAKNLLEGTKIDPKQRAQTLTIKDWKELAENYSLLIK